MDFIIDAIVEWLKGLLVDGIMGNLDGLFDNVNQSVGEIATQVVHFIIVHSLLKDYNK